MSSSEREHVRSLPLLCVCQLGRIGQLAEITINRSLKARDFRVVPQLALIARQYLPARRLFLAVSHISLRGPKMAATAANSHLHMSNILLNSKGAKRLLPFTISNREANPPSQKPQQTLLTAHWPG